MLSCNGQKKIADQKNSDAEERLLTLIAQDSYSGADSTETIVITNAKALKLFYARVNRTRKPGLPVPEVDFSKEIIVIHCSNEEIKNNEQRLSVLKETDTEMILGHSEKVIKDNRESSSINNALVNPFFVYKMPLTDKKVSFQKMK